MRWLMIILVFYASQGMSQEHYVSYIDINNTGQFAWQIEEHGENFILAVQTRCFDNLNNSCGGIIEIDSNGFLIKSYLVNLFSGNPKSILMKNENIFLIGETSSSNNTGFIYHKLLKDLSFDTTGFLSQNDEKFYNYNVTSTANYKDGIVSVGTSFAKGDCPQVGHLFVEDKIFYLDSIFELNKRGYTVIIHVQVTLKENTTLYIMHRDFTTDKDSIRIVRLDTAFHQTFEWSMEVNDNAIPRGCVTRNEDMIITIPEGFAGAYRNLWAIDTTGQVKWKWQWDANKIIKTNILRVKEAINGDLLVMGQVNGYEDYLGDIRNTAFVMRLSPDGEQKWIRYFKIADPDTRLSNYVSDLAELDNGDLQLTGQSRRIIFDADIGEYRPDQDIFWARIGGDGCINGDCSEVYTITDTQDPHEEAAIPLTIFPNPIDSDVLHVETTIRGMVDLYSQEGQQVWTTTLDAGRHTIPMAGLTAGVYVVRLRTMEGKVYSKKVVRL